MYRVNVAAPWKKAVAVVLVGVLGWLGISALLGSGTKHGVAYFASVTSVYPHDKIRILGVEVGQIDSITPESDRVRVDFSYDGRYSLPTNVEAAIVAPTLVATRFIQLQPAYDGGPTLADGGVIPEARTASPLEFDDLKTELTRLSKDLGPNAQNPHGALADFLNIAAKDGKGQGARFNAMITQLSAGLHTLAQGKGNIFATLRNLQVFVSAVKGLDGQVTTFNSQLANVSGLLNDNSADLASTIRSVDRAARLVRTFIATNRGQLKTATSRLTQLTTTLANSRNDIATLLHAGPNTLTNFYHIFSPRMSTFTGGLMVDNLATPGELVCTLIAQQTGAPTNDLTACGKYLAPLLNQLGISSIPVGTNGGIVIPGGGAPPANQTPNASPNVGAGGGALSLLAGTTNSLLGLLIPGGK